MTSYQLVGRFSPPKAGDVAVEIAAHPAAATPQADALFDVLLGAKLRPRSKPAKRGEKYAILDGTYSAPTPDQNGKVTGLPIMLSGPSPFHAPVPNWKVVTPLSNWLNGPSS